MKFFGKGRRRRGASAIQWCFVAAFVLLVCILGVRVVGTSTSGDLNQTAVEVGDPSKLTQRFGHNP